MTPDQLKATKPDASIWVGASAGTGKTHVLTARVLRLMVRGTDPQKILCLTFTKAAAAEMANRIYKDLGAWVTMGDDALRGVILTRTGETATDDMLNHARTLFGRVLDTPGGLKIQTIHSFCQSLLGRFPIEAGLTPRFQVMEDRTATELMKTSREGAFSYAKELDDTKTLSAIKHIATRAAEQTFSDLMQNVTSERGHFRQLLQSSGGANGLIKRTKEALGLGLGETKEQFLKEMFDGKNFEESEIKNLGLALADGTKTEKDKSKIILGFLTSDIENRLKNFDNYKFCFLKKKDNQPLKNVANQRTLQNHPNSIDIITQEQNRLLEIHEKLGLIEVAANTSAMIQLAESILNNYDREKDRGGYLDYTDLILKTDHLLSRPGIAPWVLFKLDGGIDHILIDEAQDTNPEQWRLIEALTHEFFTGVGAREITRTLFAVGDAKQSIFSFQRADPAEFDRAQDRTTLLTRQAEMNFENIDLNLSFRSTRAVLDCVDCVFAQEEAHQNLTIGNRKIMHNTSRFGEAGLVELWPFEPHDKEQVNEAWGLPITQLRQKSPEARLAIRIAEKIEGFLKNGDKLKSKGRTIRAGDIMVLVRRRNEFVDNLMRELKVRDIPVAGADRMMLLEQLAVMDLIAIGDFVLLPHDDLNLATLLKSPFIGLDDNDLFALSHTRPKGTSLWVTLKDRVGLSPKYKEAYDYLSKILKRADFVPPFEFYEDILVKDKGRIKLLQRLGNEANDPIDVFLSLTLGFEKDHTSSLQGFLQWIKASEQQIKRDMEAKGDQVRIMTIHGAKGLQAPIVFLPDTCQTPTNQNKLLKLRSEPPNVGGWAEDLLVWSGGSENETGPILRAQRSVKVRGDQEYRRLLYVALTRAEDQLYIGGWVTSHGKAQGSWYNLIEKGLLSHKNIKEFKFETGELGLRLETNQSAPIPDLERGIQYKKVKYGENTWINLNPAPELTPPKPLAPSRIDQDIPAESPLRKIDDIGPMGRGTLIHQLLETLPGVDKTSRKAAAFKFLEKHKSGSEVKIIWSQIQAILEAPELSALFGPNSRAEVPIAGVIGKTPFTAFLDRLLVLETEVWVIDYKTSRTPPNDISQIPEIYLKQIAFYKSALSQIFEEKKIRAILLWTEGAKWMEIPDVTLKKYKTQ